MSLASEVHVSDAYSIVINTNFSLNRMMFSASEVTTLWRFSSLIIIIVVVIISIPDVIE